MKNLSRAVLVLALLVVVMPSAASAESNTPFGTFPGTDHALCPPSSGYKWPPPPAYGDWTNSENYTNYDGPKYGCRAQDPSAGADAAAREGQSNQADSDVGQESAKPSTPRLITVDAEPRYTSIVWNLDNRPDGFNVYRNDRFVASVGSGNVYSDFGGKEGDTYYVIAYKDGNFSDRSAERRATCDSSCQTKVRPTLVGNYAPGRAVISWQDDESVRSRYAIHRDGVLVAMGTDLDSYEDLRATRSSHTYRVTVTTPALSAKSTTIRLENDSSTRLANVPPQTGSNQGSGSSYQLDPLSGRATVLAQVSSGTITPDPDTRLGAYAATLGYPEGTVGYATNNAIATLYVGFGDFGEEEIGTVFNSREAMSLYNQPVAGPAGRRMAEIEYGYWESVEGTVGGWLGTRFDVVARYHLQVLFGGQLAEPYAPTEYENNSDGLPLFNIDIDGDGIYNWADSDRDGDGVPNSRDIAPDNPAVSRPRPSGGGSDDDGGFSCPCSNSLTDHTDPPPGGDPEDYSGGAG